MKPALIKSFLVTDLSFPFDVEEEEILNSAVTKMKRAGVDSRMLHFRLYKKSLDARKKNNIRAVCSVLVTADESIALPCVAGVKPFEEAELCVEYGHETMHGRPLVVGMGPCGMFAALLLAENGYCPILIDRGGSVDERVRAVEDFYRTRVLDTSTNIQFGAGGAGTFSDGKLVTRIGDPLCRYVLETFRRFGAPEEVLTSAKPHVGTDVLRGVVSAILAEIERLGGKLIYRCRMDDIAPSANGGLLVKTEQGDIPSGVTVLAVGHSARDTYGKLQERGFSLVPKAFSVGVRIEHLQRDIDASLFGSLAGHPKLGKGEYNLSYTGGERGVYTFCMCPGGEVVAAASEEGGVVVNGMSYHARDGVNANSAVAVSVLPSDFGGDVHKAIQFQRRLERLAFKAGGSDYTVPVQTVGDFLRGEVKHEPSHVLPTYMNGSYKVADLGHVLPGNICRSLREGLVKFSRRIACFSDEDAVLSAVETRTSAPLRIERLDTLCASANDLVYPCGEGAGYAGGITSAAVDGVRVAIAVMKRFAAPSGAELA